MKKALLVLSFLLLGSLLSLACSESDEEQVLLTSPEALSGFDDEFVQALCNLHQRCNVDPVESCVEMYQGSVLMARKELVALDEAQAKRCIDGLKGLACEDFAQVHYDDYGYVQWICPQAIVGLQQEGEPCAYHPECAAGLYCDLEQGGCGRCVQGGLGCGPIGEGGEVEQVNAYCSELERCDSASGQCKPRLAAGQACARDRDCTFEHSCIQGKCVAPAELGQPCGGADLPSCTQDLNCRDNRCERFIYGLAEGQACGGEAGECGSKLFCDDESERCVPRLAEGEACSLEARAVGCEMHLFCDAESLTCKARLALGEQYDPHMANIACMSSFADETGVCLTLETSLNERCSD